MDREVNDRLEVAEGKQAQQELVLLKGAFVEVREVAMQQIIASKPEDLLFRERMIVTCQMIDAVQDLLLKKVAAGQAANTRLLMEEENFMRRT